jgi:hypothetical protein
MRDKHTEFYYKSIYMSFVLHGVYTYAPFYMQKMLGFFSSVQRIPNTDDNVFRNTQNRHIQ